MDKILSTKNWIRLFLTLIVIIVILKICGAGWISDTFALGAMGFISALITLHTTDKKINGGRYEKESTTNDTAIIS